MKQESVKNVLLLLAGAFVYSVGTQYFIVPAQIAPGGAVGIALMINHLTSLPIGTLTLLINLPLLVLAVKRFKAKRRRRPGESGFSYCSLPPAWCCAAWLAAAAGSCTSGC